MSHLYNSCRLLNRFTLVKDFLERTLDNKDYPNGSILKVVKAEDWLINNIPKTIDHSEERRNLRKQILNELWENKRLDNETEIKLGSGGALPRNDIKKEGKIFIIIGPPASGKSTIAEKISEEHGAVILDSDFAKRKLPEFENFAAGASLVHEESAGIVSGFSEFPEEEDLFKLCVEENCNIVYPKIGNSPSSIIKLSQDLNDADYEVHLLLVYVDRINATNRAFNRFVVTNRYVPLGLIFDHYGNNPILTYFYLKDLHSNLFKTMGSINTQNSSPECVDSVNDSFACNYGEKHLNWHI